VEPWLGWLFLLASYILAGLPPFVGFIGKFLLITGAFSEGHYVIASVALLASSLIWISMLRIFIPVFWGDNRLRLQPQPTRSINKLSPSMGLLSVCILLGVGAGFVYPLVHEAASSLLNPAAYIQSVLKG